MQQTAVVFENPHACLNQGAVITAAGGGDNPRIIAARHDQRHLRTAARSHAQSIQNRLIRHEIRRGDDQLMLGNINQLHEHIRHGRMPLGRAGRDHLSGETIGFVGDGRIDFIQQIQAFARGRLPVTDKHQLILKHNRPGKTHHRIHPRRKFRLRRECRIRTILAAAIRDRIINHHDFTVIAQINPTIQNAQKRIAHRQSHLLPHSSRTHLLPMRRTHQGA